MRVLRFLLPSSIIIIVALTMLGVIGPGSRRTVPAAPRAEVALSASTSPAELVGAKSLSIRSLAPPTRSTGRSLQGRVLDVSTKEPIAGVRVAIGSVISPYIDAERISLSDVNGRFKLDSSADESGFSMYVMKPGFMPVRLAMAQFVDGLDILLERGASVSGRVVDSGGLPVAGVRVSASRPWNHAGWPTQDAHRMDQESMGSEAVTDALGNFAMSGLTAGATYDVNARLEGWSEVPGSYPRVTAPSDGIELRVLAETVVTFKFVDADDGSVLADAPSLWCFPGAGAMAATDPSKRERGIVRQRYLLSDGNSRAVAIRFRTASMLYEPVSGGIEVRPSESIETTVRCRRVSGSAAKDLRLQARFPNGAAYSGHISLVLVRERGGSDPLDWEFREGVLASGVKIPAGAYELNSLASVDSSRGYWTPFASGLRVVVHDDGSCEPKVLTISGGRCLLTVRRSDGSVVRGTLVKFAEQSGRDAGWRVLGDGTKDVESLWLSPGRHMGIVGLPEIGSVEFSVEIDANGADTEKDVTLVPGEGIDLWKSRKRAAATR